MGMKGHPYATWPVIEEEELQSYVDGELDPARRTVVEAYLAANPAEGERVAAYQMQRVALQALAAPVTGQPLPESLDRLRQELVTAIATRQRRRRVLRFVVLAGVIVILGIAGVSVFGTGISSRDNLLAFARQATQAHLVNGNVPWAASTDSASADLFRWFARRVIQSPASAPDLAGSGFRLVGSQVIPAPDRANIQLIYANDQKTYLTFVMSAADYSVQRDFTYSREGDLSGWYWSRNGLQFGLVGALAKDRLLDIARLINRQMSDVADSTEPKSPLLVAPPRAPDGPSTPESKPMRAADGAVAGAPGQSGRPMSVAR